MKDDTFLARWLSGELNPKELESLESSAEYKTLSKMKANFERIESPKFSPETILSAVLQQEKVPVKVVPFYKKAWLHVAAVLLVLLGIGIPMMQPERQIAENSQMYSFHLPDRSEVTLNAGSEATYHTWNWNSKREVSLLGEAYFKVAKGKKFSVKTNLGTVTVLGTQFNVKERGNRLDVICFEGKVHVAYRSEEITLTPGKAVTFTDSGAEISNRAITEPAWIKHELEFSRETFSQVIAEIERQYDITIKTSVQTEQLFSGTLPGNNLDAILTILSTTYHLKVDRKSDIITLTAIESGP